MKSKLIIFAVLFSQFPILFSLWGVCRVLLEMQGVRNVDRIENIDQFFLLSAILYFSFVIIGYIAAGILVIVDYLRGSNRFASAQKCA